MPLVPNPLLADFIIDTPGLVENKVRRAYYEMVPEWLATYAKEHFENPTDAERILFPILGAAIWEHYHLRLYSQFPIVKPPTGYILDFFIPDKRLAIEVDDWGHFTQEHRDKDHDREAWLWYEKKIRVLRYHNDQVRFDPYKVTKKILWFMQSADTESFSDDELRNKLERGIYSLNKFKARDFEQYLQEEASRKAALTFDPLPPELLGG